jgi:dipeptidyl aminopeptidase/acylaminoacyl peptidase
MQPVTIPSRDGLRLHAYLTLPRGAQPKRLPMVVHVHGGPWLRTAWGDPVTSRTPAMPSSSPIAATRCSR